MSDPEIPSNVIAHPFRGPGKAKLAAARGKVLPQKIRPTLNWLAIAPLIEAQLSDAEIARIVGLTTAKYTRLVKLAYVNGKFDVERAKLLTQAAVANAMFETGVTRHNMPANWVMLKTLDPVTYKDRMPVDEGKKIAKLSDDELEQALLKLVEKNPKVAAKVADLTSKAPKPN